MNQIHCTVCLSFPPPKYLDICVLVASNPIRNFYKNHTNKNLYTYEPKETSLLIIYNAVFKLFNFSCLGAHSNVSKLRL